MPQISHANELDQLITIQRVTQTADGLGGYTESWATLCTAWVKVTPLGGGERRQGEAVQAPQTYRMEGRADDVAAVTMSDRVSWDSRILNIHSLPARGRGPWFSMTVEEGVAQ